MKAPRNFSFIDTLISGSAKPIEMENLDFLWNEGIRHIITVTQEPLLSLKYDKKNKFSSLHLEVSSIPDEGAVRRYVEYLDEVLKKAEKIVVHCQFGQERTGIFLAIYLIKFRRYKISKAIEEVRRLRPRSLQSSSAIYYLMNNLPDCVTEKRKK